MHLNTQISIWLNSPEDYFIGISLLSKVCKKKHLISTLQRKDTPKNRAKLVYELNKYKKTQKNAEIETNTQTVQTKRGEDTRKSKIELRRRGDGESRGLFGSTSQISKEIDKNFYFKHLISDNQRDIDVSAIAEELTQNRNALYAQRAHYHGQLSIVPTKPKRFKLAKSIMNIQPKIDKYNSQLKFITDHGKLPQELSGLIVDAKTQVRINNLISYMSRYRKKIQNSKTVAERDKYQQILDNYTAEYETLKY